MTGGEICSSIARGQPRKCTHRSWSQQALGGSMGRQDQNGTPRTRKRRPRVMEPRSPRWLHVSSRPKWPPQNLEKTPADHGATKASLAPWLSRSKMAPQRLGRRQSGAIRARLDEGFETFINLGLLPETYVDMEFTIGKQRFKIICNYNVWSTHRVST